jgi:hypothetical protein
LVVALAPNAFFRTRRQNSCGLRIMPTVRGPSPSSQPGGGLFQCQRIIQGGKRRWKVGGPLHCSETAARINLILPSYGTGQTGF